MPWPVMANVVGTVTDWDDCVRLKDTVVCGLIVIPDGMGVTYVEDCKAGSATATPFWVTEKVAGPTTSEVVTP